MLRLLYSSYHVLLLSIMKAANTTTLLLLFLLTCHLARAKESASFCSCSPQKYSFALSLSQTCEDDTLENSPGIFTTVCSTDSNIAEDDDWADFIPDVGESLVRRILPFTRHAANNQGNGKRRLNTATLDMKPVKIRAIVFAEVHSDGTLVVISKNETYLDVDLEDGAVVEFDSISKTLDPDVDIEEQLSRVPGGVVVLLVGENASGELVRSRMLWLYDNKCNAVPLAETGKIGWVHVETTESASENFCPAIGESTPIEIVDADAKAGKSTAFFDYGKSGKVVGKSVAASASKSGKAEPTKLPYVPSNSGKSGKSAAVEAHASLEDVVFAKVGGSSTTEGDFVVDSGADVVIVTDSTQEESNEKVDMGTESVTVAEEMPEESDEKVDEETEAMPEESSEVNEDVESTAVAEAIPEESNEQSSEQTKGKSGKKSSKHKNDHEERSKSKAQKKK